MHRDRDTEELAIELMGVSAMILGLSNQLDDDEINKLSNEYMSNALCGLSSHLERISNDLSEIERI